MPLNMPEPPGRMREETRAKLGRVAGVRGMGLPALGAAAPENVEVSTPHQVFTMGLDDVEAGGGLERARPGAGASCLSPAARSSPVPRLRKHRKALVHQPSTKAPTWEPPRPR